MRITKAEFIAAAYKPAQYPAGALPEVILVGRSNVGKSSLINAIVGVKGLAKTSSVPGKTQTINFYRINDGFYLVDLPGFGYANVPKRVKKSWEAMVAAYVNERANLRGAVVILDPRRDPGDVEEGVYRWLLGECIPRATVLTKSDKLSRNEMHSRLAAIKKAIPDPGPIAFSSVTGEGKIALLRRIQEMLEGGGGAGINSDI
ncbi:MAG: YihA family ribosome biogenesis GTP-binding protein [Deltaproteobacteria bacterium]|nr:YihA family ribosome biogenesis GTP-binding protein [Deltaproteobacteria bacterium]